MVPDKFNMVDMGGIDVLESQGIVVSGLYQRLVNSIANCKYQCLYNWKFDGVDIAPTYVELTILAGVVKINDYIWVTQDDIVHIYSIEVEPVIESLDVDQNGVYTPRQGVDGFSPVNVDVEPEIQSLSVTENGTYNVPSGIDGFNPVTVDVAGDVIETVSHYAWNYSGWSGWAVMKTLNNVVKGRNLNSNNEGTLEGDIIDFTYYGGTSSAPYVTAKTSVQLKVYQTSLTTNVISPIVVTLNADETYVLSILNYNGGYYIEASEVD